MVVLQNIDSSTLMVGTMAYPFGPQELPDRCHGKNLQRSSTIATAQHGSIYCKQLQAYLPSHRSFVSCLKASLVHLIRLTFNASQIRFHSESEHSSVAFAMICCSPPSSLMRQMLGPGDIQ